MKRLILLCSAVLTIMSGCNSSGSKKNENLPPPNILWINCEDISPNLGCYGDAYATTPNLDALAEKGVLFSKAFAAAPICSPSRSTLITGIPATSLGTQHLRNRIDLPDFILTLPEYLTENGYFTSMYGKTDYNFNPDRPEERFDYLHWREDWAPWRQRGDQPWYGYFTLGMTHEGTAQKTKSWKRNTKDLDPALIHDPDKVPVPAIHPDTPAMREVWAHYYDNITVLDTLVGHILGLLEADGEMENTFVFFFSDHGAGMPGYKRWLYTTGLQVPFIVYIPEKYRHLAPFKSGAATEQIVTFSDFAPTVLNLAGVEIPETMEGIPFMGEKKFEKRDHVVCSRSRADNMYETSRCVIDDRYFYTRNYRPQYPYMQPGYIFDTKEKEAFVEINRLHRDGDLNPEFERFYYPKPVEELYDLVEDPDQFNNLAGDPVYEQTLLDMREQLHEWMLDTRDLGLLNEPEYMIRSAGSTPYEMGHDPDQYDIKSVMDAAEMVGMDDVPRLAGALKSEDSGVRYWAVMGLQYLEGDAVDAIPALEDLLDDPSPVVQVEAAFTLARLAQTDIALPVLEKWVQDERPWLALQAARSIELLKGIAKPLVPTLYEVMEKYAAGPDSNSRFRDGDFAFFISMSVIYALENCGEEFDNPLD